VGKKICIENPLRWVSIDPGIGGTGLAFWENDKLLVEEWDGAKGVHTIRPGKSAGDDWMEKAISICALAEEWFDDYCPTLVVIEEPFVSLRGKKTLVAAQAGSVVKLSVLAGMLVWTARSVLVHPERFFDVKPVSPMAWKGQLPDPALKARIEAWAKKTKTKLPSRLSEHARDALGLGLSHLNEL